RVMNGLRTGCVEDCGDVVPSIWGEALEWKARSLPFFRRVIEDAPRIAGVVGLPGEIVGIPICGLLALEFDRLRSIRKFRRNKEIQVVAEIADRIGNRGLLDEVVASCVRRTAVDVKVCRRSTQARVRNTLAHVLVGSLSYAPEVPAAATSLPSGLTLETGIHNCA